MASLSSEGADVPEQLEDVQGDRRWMDLHEKFVKDAKNKEPDVVFIGDSLIERLRQSLVWAELFEPLHCLNFGIGGDTTNHLLWRIENGELDDMKPKVVVVLIGTNNHQHTAEAVAKGVQAVAALIRCKQSSAHLIVLPIPPRGKKDNPLRQKIATINQKLAETIPTIENAEFLDPKAGFIQSDGTIGRADLFDFLHFTNNGYRKYFQPVAERIRELVVVVD